MEMNVVFYNYNGKPETINKTLQTIKTANINPYNDFDKNNPSIIVDYYPELNNCNYIKIDNNYYYGGTPILGTGSRMIFNLTIDLLMSYRAEILNLNVITNRTVNEYNSFLFDDRQKTPVNFTTYSIDVGTIGDFTQSSIILAVIGGS